MDENELGRIVIDAAVMVHRELGPGMKFGGFRADVIVENKVILTANGLPES